MNDVKKYKEQDSGASMLMGEPVASYGNASQFKTMPCVYTDEEFVEEIRLAEESGYISHEEALKSFEKWGLVR